MSQDAPAMPAAHPLFFSDPKIITLEAHGETRLRPDLGMGFARPTGLIPLIGSDFAEAAKSYPIGFTGGAMSIPIAIVGLEQENYFVDADGKWDEDHYVPAYVRKYPFVFQQTSADGQLTLCVDEPALASAGDAEGARLFEDEAASAFARVALEFCAMYQREHLLARQLCDTLARLDLLVTRNVDTQLAGGGRTIRMQGLLLLDEEKFRALPSRDILFLHQQNSLGPLYYALQSQSNWRRLLTMANAREGRQATAA